MKTGMVEQDPTQELIERSQRGDKDAFGQLLEEHRARLLGFIRSHMSANLQKTLEPEDVLQDTLARSWEMIARFKWRGRDSFLRWLTAIAEHLILNAAQKSARSPLQLDRDLQAEGISSSRARRREERFQRLQDALRSLTPDQRQAIQLARMEGLPILDVAKQMKKSPETVKKIITRALRRLELKMGDTKSFHLPARQLEFDGNDDE